MIRNLPRNFAAILASLVFGLGLSLVATPSPVAGATGGTGAMYVPFGPTRFVDSRISKGVSGVLKPYAPVTFAVAGQNGVPSNALAVTGDLVAVGATAGGWIALTKDPIAKPTTSTVNMPVGDTRANGVFAPLSSTGALSVTASVQTNVIFDVTGYFTASAGATWNPVGPTRFLDTRIAGQGGVFASGKPRTLMIAGVAGVPSDAVGVTGNITVVVPTCGGNIAVTQNPTSTPGTSTLNFPAGDIRANNFVSPLANDGSIGIVFSGCNSSARTNIVVDVTGYFANEPGGALYYPIAPTRIADSRSNDGIDGPVSDSRPVTVTISGAGSPVPTSAQAITANLTVTDVRSGGNAAITPFATTTSGTSTINFPAGDTRANGFVVALGSDSIGLDLESTGGTSQFIIDVTGYFAGGSFADPVAPVFTGMSLYRSTAWSHQATQTWCTGASTQMILNLVTGASDHSSASQSAYVSYAFNHSIYVAKEGVEADGWANAVTHSGAGFYSIVAYPTFAAAMKAAATRMRITGKPVGLVVQEGHHAWVMAGFTSVGDDPATSQNFTVTSATIMAPDYGTISYDPAPGSVESMSYMAVKLDGYTDDFPTIWDHQFVIIQP
jgi:hypothetical protein